MTYALTDPARELAELLEELQQFSISENTSGFGVIATYTKTDQNSQVYLDLISAISMRISEIYYFVENTGDADFRDKTRQQTAAAVGRISSIIHPQVLTQPWSVIRQKYLREQDIALVDALSSIMRRYFPLLKVFDEDVETLKVRLSDALVEAEATTDLSEAQKFLVASSIRRLLAIVNHLPIFGLSRALEVLLVVASKISAVSDDKKKEESKWLKDTMNALALAFAFFCGPSAGIQALDHYKEIYHERIEWVKKSFPDEIQQYNPKFLEDLRNRNDGDPTDGIGTKGDDNGDGGGK